MKQLGYSETEHMYVVQVDDDELRALEHLTRLGGEKSMRLLQLAARISSLRDAMDAALKTED